MAITVNLEASFGEIRNLYVRLNNISASNHGVVSKALFRGYGSQQMFHDGAPVLWEKEIELMVNASGYVWKQAYQALKGMDGFSGYVDC